MQRSLTMLLIGIALSYAPALCQPPLTPSYISVDPQYKLDSGNLPDEVRRLRLRVEQLEADLDSLRQQYRALFGLTDILSSKLKTLAASRK